MVRVEESTKEEAAIKVKLEEEAATKVVLSVTTKGSGNDGINISYKVVTKEIPVVPANKTLKGKNIWWMAQEFLCKNVPGQGRQPTGKRIPHSID